MLFNIIQITKEEFKDSSTLIVFAKFLRKAFIGVLFPKLFEYLKKKDQKFLIKGKQLIEELNALGFKHIPIENVEHHLCHARAVYHSFFNDKVF